MKIAFDPQGAYPKIEPNKENIAHKNDPDTLKQLCQDFESIFINSLFQEMRKSIPHEGFFEHDMGMDIFQEIMDMEVAREMSRQGGLGLGRLLYSQLQHIQDINDQK